MLSLRTVLVVSLATVLALNMTAFAQEAPTEATALTLDQAVALALENADEAAIADERINAARATVRESEATAYPQVTGIAGYTYNINQPKQEIALADAFNPILEALGLPPNAENPEMPLVYRHEWAFTLDVQQTLAVGRVAKAIKLARLYEETSRLGRDVTDQDIVLGVTQAYYDVVLAGEFLAVAKQNLTLSEKHLADTQAKFDAGLKSEFELLQARVDVSAAEPNVIQMESATAVAKKNLLRVLNRPLDGDVTCLDGFSELVPARDATSMNTTAQESRKELVLLRTEREMKDVERRLYTSSMFPYLSANMNYTHSGQSMTNEDDVWPVEEDWYDFWSVGVSLNWPIFNGMADIQKARRAKAEERISRLNASAAAKGIELEVTELITRLDTVERQLSARRESMDLADRAFGLASVRYDNGLGTMLEKADAKAIWTQARVAWLQTLYELNMTRARLDRALGKDPTP